MKVVVMGITMVLLTAGKSEVTIQRAVDANLAFKTAASLNHRDYLLVKLLFNSTVTHKTPSWRVVQFSTASLHMLNSILKRVQISFPLSLLYLN